MYHQKEIKEANKVPGVVSDVNPKEWPQILEMVEDYIRKF